ncbi:MAG: carbohydrate kinase family protein [Brevinema sp.]
MIACIGISVIDLIFDVDTPIKENIKNQAQNFRINIGGNGANVAKVLSHFGHCVSFISFIGEDYFGNLIYHDLNSLGINILQQKNNSYQTPISVVINNIYQSSRTIFNYKTLKFDDMLFEFPEKPRWIYSDARFPHYVKYCRQKFSDISVLWDWERKEHYLQNQCLVKKGDILICSEDFVLETIEENQNEQQLINDLYKNTNISTIIITKGSKGVSWSTHEDSKLKNIPSLDVVAIDTNGAGDVFHATFLHYLLEGSDILTAILKSIEVSGYFVSHQGFLSALPDL